MFVHSSHHNTHGNLFFFLQFSYTLRVGLLASIHGNRCMRVYKNSTPRGVYPPRPMNQFPLASLLFPTVPSSPSFSFPLPSVPLFPYSLPVPSHPYPFPPFPSVCYPGNLNMQKLAGCGRIYFTNPTKSGRINTIEIRYRRVVE